MGSRSPRMPWMVQAPNRAEVGWRPCMYGASESLRATRPSSKQFPAKERKASPVTCDSSSTSGHQRWPSGHIQKKKDPRFRISFTRNNHRTVGR